MLALQAAFFSIALLAVVVCVCIGYTIQRRECLKWFPSSGVVVLVGIVIGVIVQASDSAVAAEFEVAIKFDAQFFSLVFLPIIIFQSGYALKKHPFFSQVRGLPACCNGPRDCACVCHLTTESCISIPGSWCGCSAVGLDLDFCNLGHTDFHFVDGGRPLFIGSSGRGGTHVWRGGWSCFSVGM